MSCDNRAIAEYLNFARDILVDAVVTGILEEYGVAHYWRNAKVLEIFEGSKEVEKVIIARKILGRY